MAAAVLGAAEAAQRELATARERLAGRLMVGVYPTGHLLLVPRALARLREAHPEIEVALRNGGSRWTLHQLRTHQLEVAVIVSVFPGLEHDLTGLRYEKLFNGRLQVAVSQDHRLAGQASVTAEDLGEEPWIVGTSSPTDVPLGALPGIAEPRIAYAVRDWHARVGMVAAGLGVTLVPGSVTSLMSAGVTVLPVADDAGPERQVLAVTQRERPPLARALVGVLHQVAEPGAL